MKHIILLLVVTVSFAISQGTQLGLYDYQLQTNANVKTKNGKIGFATLKPVKNPADSTTFGFWITNNTNSNATFLEIKDGQKTLATISAKDFSAKAKITTSGTKSIATYTSGTGANAIELKLESDIVTDEMMPLSKSVEVSLKAKSAGNKTFTATMNVYADGFIRKLGTSGISTSRVVKGKADYPLVVLAGKSGTSVTTDNVEQRSSGKLLKVTSGSVPSAGEEVVLLSLNVNGTTVKSFENSAKQASNVENTISTKKEITELALLNTASKANPFPGDTITYTVTYHNIGNSPAQDITISNPIPQNTIYIENSAAGESAEVTLEKKSVAPPQQGEVIAVTWKITKRVLPGEEGTVSFKSLVR